ncbi:hypothetical protein PLICRDRAFT_511813 [Plicaturopsis crispa FD-325 SS-3]|nr:hypothetical protein PLICRDRAFT_511813 [Plicaturopsis crispa FD-325 SS-3]
MTTSLLRLIANDQLGASFTPIFCGGTSDSARTVSDKLVRAACSRLSGRSVHDSNLLPLPVPVKYLIRIALFTLDCISMDLFADDAHRLPRYAPRISRKLSHQFGQSLAATSRRLQRQVGDWHSTSTATTLGHLVLPDDRLEAHDLILVAQNAVDSKKQSGGFAAAVIMHSARKRERECHSYESINNPTTKEGRARRNPLLSFPTTLNAPTRPPAPN